MNPSHKISLAFESIQVHEPFTELEIRAIQIVDDQCQWRSFNDPRVEFFSVYGRSDIDKLHYIVADCLDLETAQEVATALNTFAGFALPIIEHRIHEC